MACLACVAKHHRACWDDAGACAACGAERVLAEAPAVRPRARGVATLYVLASLGTAFLALVTLALPLVTLVSLGSARAFVSDEELAVYGGVALVAALVEAFLARALWSRARTTRDQPQPIVASPKAPIA